MLIAHRAYQALIAFEREGLNSVVKDNLIDLSHHKTELRAVGQSGRQKHDKGGWRTHLYHQAVDELLSSD